MSKTKIEWAEETINPFAGCSKVSPGCDNCYALRMAWRLANNPNPKIADKYRGTVEKVDGKVRWTGSINKDLDCMEHLYNGRKGKILFVGSMGDIGHENLYFDLFSAIMDKCYSINNHRIHYSDGTKEPHKFLFLTKRPDRFKALWEMYFKANDIEENRDNWQSWPLHDDVYSTFWVGVTIEDQKALDKRAPELIQIPAAKRFISYEPALGPLECLDGWLTQCDRKTKLIDLVICGGESGPGARPVHPEWVRGVRDQCEEAGVPFFFKQWGEWVPGRFDKQKGKMICNSSIAGRDIGRIYWTNPGCPKTHLWDQINQYWTNASAKIGKKYAGRILDGKEYLEWPE